MIELKFPKLLFEDKEVYNIELLKQAKEFHSNLCKDCQKKEYKNWCEDCKSKMGHTKITDDLMNQINKLLKN